MVESWLRLVSSDLVLLRATYVVRCYSICFTPLPWGLLSSTPSNEDESFGGNVKLSVLGNLDLAVSP